MCFLCFKENGIQNSYERPPNVPPFSGRPPKRKTTGCGETFTALEDVVTKVIQNTTDKTETVKEPEVESGKNAKVIQGRERDRIS